MCVHCCRPTPTCATLPGKQYSPNNCLPHYSSQLQFHHALLEVHLEEGALVCPETGERSSADWKHTAVACIALPVCLLCATRSTVKAGSRAAAVHHLPSRPCAAGRLLWLRLAPTKRHSDTDGEGTLRSLCQTGYMTACLPAAGRKFQVSGGIPNLLLQEDEC